MDIDAAAGQPDPLVAVDPPADPPSGFAITEISRELDPEWDERFHWGYGPSPPLPDGAPPGGRCPTCRREIVWPDNPHRPFCSASCRLIDLGVWLDEGYRIPGPRAASEPAPDDRGPGSG